MNKISLVLGVLISLPAYAQQEGGILLKENENELEEIVIQGNRIEVPFSQTTRDIQIITQKQLGRLPVKSLNEALSYISGVNIRQRGPFGTQADISIDGGTSEQAIVLINGIKMIDSQTAHNMMNLPIPLTAIDHIEILRGAAARKYGINALTGAINIVTRKENHSFITMNLQASSSFESKEEGDGSGVYGGGGAELTGNLGTKNQSHLFSLAHNHYNGQRYNSASNNTRLFYNGHFDVDSHNKMQTMLGYSQSRFGANGFYAAPGDRNSEELVNSSIFSLSSKHQWDNFTLSPRISNRYGEDDYRYYKDDLSKGRSLHYTNALMLELNSRVSTKIGTLGFGWESRLEQINSSNIGEHRRNNHGAYAELASGWGEKLRGTLGLYTNYNTDFGWQVYPGIDVAYLINADWRISTSIGSGQRIPSFTDLYLDQLPGNVGNSGLQPEDAWTYESNIRYKHDNLNLQTGYFFRRITNFIDWVREDPSQPYSPINFGENDIQGFYGRISQNFYLGDEQSFGYRASYNYLSPSIESSTRLQSKYVLESLKHQVIVGLNYELKDFTFQIENRWLQRELSNPYNIADIRLNYHWRSFVFHSVVTNLFNEEYKEAGAVPMPGRWFSIGMKYHWDQL